MHIDARDSTVSATRDGTFGTTGRGPPFETELAQQLESHAFEPVKLIRTPGLYRDRAPSAKPPPPPPAPPKSRSTRPRPR